MVLAKFDPLLGEIKENDFPQPYPKDASFLKNIGIGTDNPDDKLHVAEATNGSDCFIKVQAGGTTNDQAGVLLKTSQDATDNYFHAGIIFQDDGSANAGGKLHLVNNNTIANATYLDGCITITPSGNVGIKNQSPTSAFQVSGATIMDGGLTQRFTYMLAAPITGMELQSNAVASSTNRVKMSPSLSFRGQAWNISGTAASAGNAMSIYEMPVTGSPTSARLTIANNTIDGVANGSELMSITSNGRVGVGTTNPDAKLHISGNMILTGSSLISGTTINIGSITSFSNLIGSGLDIKGSANIVSDLLVSGNTYIRMPYAMYSSTETQVGSPTNTALPVTFNNIEDTHQMTISGGSIINIQNGGDYLINISAIATNNSPTSARFQIWPCINGSDVPRSNTIYDFKGQNTYAVIAVPYIVDLRTNDTFCLKFAASADTVSMVYTGSTTYSPSTPSIIMSINKLGEITP